MNEVLFSKLIVAAAQSGITVDALLCLISGLEDNSVARLLDNVSSLPTYMKSKDMPYRDCIVIAPSIEIRKSPLSH